jgi:transcriptional regulator with XRE-family HTH domain
MNRQSDSLRLLNSRFGLCVRKLRKAKGWTQEILAEHADLNRSYVGEIERGSVVSSLYTIIKLARALNKTPGALLNEI